MNGKRLFDIVIALAALVFVSPIMIIATVWIKLDSRGPVIYRQKRVGLKGQLFDIFKLRTMCVQQTEDELLVTETSDSRITRCGKVLRKLKLDELPQFANVLLGQMSIVGPRPEVEKYVDRYPIRLRNKILSIRPGITDNAAIAFRNEGDLLAAADDPEKEYIETILPMKLALYEKYVDEQSLGGDFMLIIKTAVSVLLQQSKC